MMSANPLTASSSAPGKLILFGEHAVVHGQPAIAAALSDLRLYVTVNAREDGIAQIEMTDLKPTSLFYRFPAQSLLYTDAKSAVDDDGEIDTSTFENKILQSDPNQTLHDVACINEILNTQFSSSQLASQNAATETKILPDHHRTPLIPLIYLLNLVTPQLLTSHHGFSIKISSQNLPVGAGLGSSAAYGVATAAALYKLRIILSSHNDNSKEVNLNNNVNEHYTKPSTLQLDVINKLSLFSETLIHETPSGIDNAVSTYGGAIYFMKNPNGEKVMEQMHSLPPLNIILTNTNVPRSTKVMVQKVRSFKERFPLVASGLFDAIGGITRSFRNITSEIEQNQCNQQLPTGGLQKKLKQDMNIENQSSEKSQNNGSEYQTEISSLIRINQQLLSTLNVSHPIIDKLCSITTSLYNDHKCTTKITGAGGGGCVFTFLENTLDDGQNIQQRIQAVTEAIETINETNSNCNDYDFGSSDSFKVSCFSSTVGSSGVLWF